MQERGLNASDGREVPFGRASEGFWRSRDDRLVEEGGEEARCERGVRLAGRVDGDDGAGVRSGFGAWFECGYGIGFEGGMDLW